MCIMQLTTGRLGQHKLILIQIDYEFMIVYYEYYQKLLLLPSLLQGMIAYKQRDHTVHTLIFTNCTILCPTIALWHAVCLYFGACKPFKSSSFRLLQATVRASYEYNAFPNENFPRLSTVMQCIVVMVYFRFIYFKHLWYHLSPAYNSTVP